MNNTTTEQLRPLRRPNFRAATTLADKTGTEWAESLDRAGLVRLRRFTTSAGVDVIEMEVK